MMRYADPLVCPDCRRSFEYGVPACPHCALPLRGAAAQELYTTLLRADSLIEQLRVSAAAPAPAAAVPMPGSVPPPAAPRPSRLDAASVPKILLGLGATCLLVAALVFLAVAWSSMGMTGRTVVLLTLTALAATTMVWLARRTLRAGSESFAVVALGLLALDLSGAEDAGWFGDLSGGGFTLLLGGILAAAGLSVARYGQSSPVNRLASGEVVAFLGTAAAGLGLVDLLPDHVGALVAIFTTLAVAAIARAGRFTDLALGLAMLAALWWLMLLLAGLGPIVDDPTASYIWGDLKAWPLLVAAALSAVPAVLGTLASPLRVTAAGIAAATLGLTASVVVIGNPLDHVAYACLAVLAVAVVGVATLPLPWRWASVSLLVPAAVGVVFLTLLQGGYAASRLVFEPWSAAPGDHVRNTDLPLAGWLLPLLVAGLVASVGAGARLLEESLDWRIAAPVILALTAAATLASYDVTLWVPFTALAVGTLAAYLLEARQGALHVASAASAVLLLAAAHPSDWLTLVALIMLSALAANTALREAEARSAELVLTPLVGAAVGTALSLADVGEHWIAVLVLAAVCAIALVRPRPLIELGTAVTGLVAIVAQEPDLTWLAVDLTVAGVLVTTSGLLHRRDELNWVGGALLMAATWVRLADLGVDTPEAYTLPLAAVLVAVGLYRMWRSDIGSWPALAPGLALAVSPTLILVLAEPVTARAVWLGAGCLALVLAGVWLRWSGPLLVGAGAGGLEVIREATYASVLPQWVLIALVGAVLTVIGVTWEQRLRDLRLAAGYVRGLR